VVKACSIGGPCIYLYLLCCFDPGGVVQGKQQEGRHYNPTRKGLPLFRLIKLAVMARAFLLQTVVARIVVQQNVIRSAVVPRAAVERNWDLPYLPCKKWRTAHVSKRDQFWDQFRGGQFWGLFPNRKSSSGQEFRVRLYEKTYTRRLSVQKIILATKTSSR
jgi:hypothetical protein